MAPATMRRETQYVAALDQGTTSARVIVFSDTTEPVASHQIDLNQIYPNPGWVEHDPREIIEASKQCLVEVAQQLKQKGISLQAVKALGISNQRETSILWDRTNGEPVYNAIVWSDIRTKEVVESLKKCRGADRVPDLCGLPLNPYFAALKVRWMLNEVPKAKEVYEAGNLCFGTVDSWLLYNFTGGVNRGRHITDVTNASRSMLMNLKTLQYDDELIKFFGFEKLILPEIVSSSELYGHLSLDIEFNGLPVAGCLGDQSSALVGHQGFEAGDAKNTYGTGCFLLYNTGNQPVRSKNGLLTTVAYQFKGQEPVYALEGSIAVAGSIVKWFKNNLGIIETSEQMNELASQVDDTGGVVFVTALSGLFAPYWRSDARGTIVGMTAYTNRCHLARAALEATCFQTKAILDCMAHDSNTPFRALQVDGGLTNSNVAMQIQADILGIDVVRPPMREPTALGCGLAAGLAVGVWDSIEHLKSLNTQDGHTTFKGTLNEDERNAKFSMWEKAVEKACGWA
jgi:glycerol kinase